jgi:nucleoside 2-deoxyribosyltransferase
MADVSIENPSSDGDRAKSCFVISPIGSETSDVRRRSDQVLKYVIEDVLRPAGYDVERADRIAEAGRIDSQILERIVSADLVIADLTGANPNVYYELAVRHALAKPFVQICEEGEALPFDIANLRTIFFNHNDLDSVASAKAQLATAVNAVSNQAVVETPLSVTVNLQALRTSADPEKRFEAQMLTFMGGIERRLDRIDGRLIEVERDQVPPRIEPRPTRAGRLQPLTTELAELLQTYHYRAVQVVTKTHEIAVKVLGTIGAALPTELYAALSQKAVAWDTAISVIADDREIRFDRSGYSDEPPF